MTPKPTRASINSRWRLIAAAVCLPALLLAQSPGVAPGDRTDEMLAKMRAAVEEIAGLYGNPSFVQIFTNSQQMADQLRERLKQTDSLKRLRAETLELEAKRDRLANDIAQAEQEARRLSERLSKQRAALDSVASAISATNRAVEGTTP